MIDLPNNQIQRAAAANENYKTQMFILFLIQTKQNLRRKEKKKERYIFFVKLLPSFIAIGTRKGGRRMLSS